MMSEDGHLPQGRTNTITISWSEVKAAPGEEEIFIFIYCCW